jgi:FdhE protein
VKAESNAERLLRCAERAELLATTSEVAGAHLRAAAELYRTRAAGDDVSAERRAEPPESSAFCPDCAGPPRVAARRAAPESDGALRFLVCADCGTEWRVARVLCPHCGEERPEKLPVFENDRYPAHRIEACETCRHYVKSIDLTVDARPIPEVDDLLSISLDLWAAEQGWTRIGPAIIPL